MDEDISDIESDSLKECSESFGDISRISEDDNGESKVENSHEIESEESFPEESSPEESSIAEESYDPTSFIEISDILDLVGKKWSIFRVSPLWNFKFDTSHLKLLSKQLNDYLIKHNTTNLKNQNNSFSQISAELEAKEAHHEYIALKIQVINKETNTQLYNGLLLKSPNYTRYYKENNLSNMPVLMVQGNKTTIISVHNWITTCFDCVIRPYEFARYHFLFLIAISMGDAGQSYNEIVLYQYLYKYELSKGQMDIKFFIESEFLRLILAKLSSNRSTSGTTSFHYSDLINVQTEVEDRFNIASGINISKLKLQAFEAPKVASFNISGKITETSLFQIKVLSSSLMDLMLKFIMELENDKCMY